ncbi:hypothetical protein SDRG_15714 [Saprolegnia diclina VS20]|uniref:Uncharacterized protein n=1 Tax=Saprolegnia diclina (strain VS20) TaxID=1156394 RepID=T0RAE0_SAPDV|nr:hypothetical protein SDRG_15714 [Saprolegnia diclina VS20]EQC26472.1 hypothetical protein SDRG_15714 [Saprolegnia diclina VS20]|eukprot:XP_008620118.1 hypothetical protein SDRG_15714 [Saprolegnia diclina VS20]
MKRLCDRLGLLFELYNYTIAAALMAANGTSKVIMHNLVAHGSHSVCLRSSALSTTQHSASWRHGLVGAKVARFELAEVILKLMASLSDSHPRVKEAGHAALVDITRPRDGLNCLYLARWHARPDPPDDGLDRSRLQTPLLDPISEGHMGPPKARGMLVKDQDHYSHLVRWLQHLMHLDALVHGLRDEIIQITRHSKDAICQCVLWVIAFLPPALDNGFFKYHGSPLDRSIKLISQLLTTVDDLVQENRLLTTSMALSNDRILFSEYVAVVTSRPNDEMVTAIQHVAIKGLQRATAGATSRMQASRRDTSRASTPEMSNAAVALAVLEAQARDAVALTMLDIVASLPASSQV